MVPVMAFVPPSALLPVSCRIRVQLQDGLFFGARVVFNATEEGQETATMIPNSGFHTFLAHDGEQVMFFSTDCESFVEMLDHAVTTRQLENDFKRNMLPGAADPHAQTLPLTASSVLQHYVVEMTVLAVRETSLLTGVDATDPDRQVVYQYLCRDRGPPAHGHGPACLGRPRRVDRGTRAVAACRPCRARATRGPAAGAGQRGILRQRQRVRCQRV